MAAALQLAAGSCAAAFEPEQCCSESAFKGGVGLLSTSLPAERRGWPRRQSRKGVVRLQASNADIGVSSSPDTAEQKQEPSVIQLQFLWPEAGRQLQTASAVSGDKLLRTIMLDNKFELYDLWGKAMNCGGGGSCGTCIVQILEGQELLNERTDTENKYLKKKPDNWRLSCQTIVGNKTNSGKVVVQRLPQKKKK